MPRRKRMMDPRMLTDAALVRCCRDARSLFSGMILVADDDGYGDADRLSLRVAIFPGDNDITDEIVEKLLTELVANGLAEVRANIYYLPGWLNTQSIRKDIHVPSTVRQRYEAVTPALRDRNVTDTQVSKKVSKKEERKESAAAPPPDFKIVNERWTKKVHKAPEEKQVYQFLEICRTGYKAGHTTPKRPVDANPLEVLKIWDPSKTPSPFAILAAMAKDRDAWADRVGSWFTFVNSARGSPLPAKEINKKYKPETMAGAVEKVVNQVTQ